MTKLKETKINKPAWLKLSEEEMEKIILDLSSKYSPAQIGLILRDQYGVPTTKVYGKKLCEYLEKAGKNVKPELENAKKKFDTIKEHLESNKQDKRSKHKFQKAQSHLNAMNTYYGK